MRNKTQYIQRAMIRTTDANKAVVTQIYTMNRNYESDTIK